MAEGDEVKISCTVKNSGSYEGAEVVQLYVKAPDGVFKPEKELKGFEKVYLKAGEQKAVEIRVNKADLRYWNIKEERWIMEGGAYEFQICSDCQTVRLRRALEIEGETAAPAYEESVNNEYLGAHLDTVTDEIFERMSGRKIPTIPKKKPVRMESRFTDLKATFMGKILFDAVLSVAKKDMKKAKKLPEGAERDNKIKGAIFLKRILESNSIITMSMSAGNSCPYHFAQGMVHLANGHLIKGIKSLMTPIKVPKLPKDEEEK